MIWIYLALAAYFINAIVFIVDKHLLASPIPKPYSYSFGIAILSLGAIVLIPLGINWYSWNYFLVTLFSGAATFIGLIYLYKTIRLSDISISATQVGALSAVFTYIFSIIVFNDIFPAYNNLALLPFILGIIFLGKIHKVVLKYAIISGILLGLSFVLLKLSFQLSDFVNGLFWTRMGFIGSALFSLVFSEARKEVYNTFKVSSNRSKLLFVLNKGISAIGFILLYLAVFMGNVSIINSLLGFQFLFIFILALMFKDKISGLRENIDKKTVIFKLLGILFIIFGFIILFK